ncbi:hypothetical protein ACIPVB_00710 [Microbacterium sp. NPDC090007]|uniref:hypothetical protein n=1 Tax=Microbacterium sp. NPDC090007 TaxID=3364204 RepID=UPI003803759C
MTSDDGATERVPRKRLAFEPPHAPEDVPPGGHRPLATVAGAVLVLLRALAGAVWAVSVAFALPPWLRDAAGAWSGDAGEAPDFRASDLGVDSALFLGILGAVAALQVVLGIRILFGGNRSRVFVMLISVVSIALSFVGWWELGQEISVRTTFITLALDILVLLALSSRDAAAYARRPRTPRRARAPRRAGAPRRARTRRSARSQRRAGPPPGASG